MAKTGNFVHQVSDSTAVAAVGTSYAGAKKTAIKLRGGSNTAAVGAILSAVTVKVSSISSATKLSIQISTDSNGDDIIVPSSEATLGIGVTTATKGAAVYDLAILFRSTSDQLYVFYKTDAGTVTVDSVDISWRE